MDKRLREKIAWAKRRRDAAKRKEDYAEAGYYAAKVVELEKKG